MTDERSDFHLLLAYGRRNWWVIAACVVVALLLAALYLQARDNEYRATAVLLIQPQTETDTRDALAATPELVRSQLEIATSQRVLDATVAKLRLADNPDFTEGAPANASRALKEAAARESLFDRLDVENDGRSYTIRLSAEAETPRAAANLANAVASTYIATQRAQKVQVIEATGDALSRRLADLRDQTNAAEAQAEAFRRQSGLIPLSSVPEDSESYAAATPASREIIEMSKEHAALAARRADAQARYSAQQRAIARGQGQSTAEVLDSQVVSDLRTREAEVAQRQSELLARYGPDHPLIQPVRAELSELRQNIGAEIRRIHGSVASRASASSQAFQSGDDFMGKLEQDRSRDLAAGIRLNQLQREAKLKRDTYEEYAAQMQRSAERAGLQLPDVLLVSPAAMPFRKANSDPALVLVVAALLGLIVGLALGFVRSLLAQRRTVVQRTVEARG